MLQQADSIITSDLVVPAAIAADTTDIQQSVVDSSLSRFESGTFLSKDSLSYTEIHLPGEAGDPVPYTMRGDDILVCLVLFCFLMTIGVFAHSRHPILYQLKEFFHTSRTEYADTDVPGKFTLFILNLQASLLLGIVYYSYTTYYVAADYLLDSPYQLIAVYFGVFFVYFLVKSLIYLWVNIVFFDGKKSRLMAWMLFFISALEGLAFFPVVIMQVYAGLSMQNVVYYFIFVLIIAKLMTFYKCWIIFFRQIRIFLQIILYLCTLEIIPLLILWGVLVTITNELKVTF